MKPRMILFFVVWISCSAIALSSRSDQKALKGLLAISKAWEAKAQAEAEAKRMALLEEAIKLSEKEQAKARTELERVELEQAKLQHRIHVRNWALGSFESAERGVTPPIRIAKNLQHLETARLMFRTQFLKVGQESSGAVKTGRALNFFLDACGGVALQHELLRQQIEDCLKNPSRLSQKQRDDLLEVRAILDQIGGKHVLTAEVCRHIRYLDGISGNKLIIDARDGALPLNWPSVLTTNPQFQPYMDQLAAAKKQAIDDLRAGNLIAPETQAEMRAAADNIRIEFDRWAMRSSNDRETTGQRISTRNFVQGLREGAYRFAEARMITDVEPIERFNGTRIEQLLAFSARHGYRFDRPDVNGENEYWVLYQQMVDYYMSLYSVQLAVQSDIRNELELDRRADKLFKDAFRNTMDDLKGALEARPSQNPLETILDITEIGANVSEIIKNLKKDEQSDERAAAR